MINFTLNYNYNTDYLPPLTTQTSSHICKFLNLETPPGVKPYILRALALSAVNVRIKKNGCALVATLSR